MRRCAYRSRFALTVPGRKELQADLVQNENKSSKTKVGEAAWISSGILAQQRKYVCAPILCHELY